MCATLFAWIIRPMRIRAIRRAETRLPVLCKAISNCESRRDLEALLGEPQIAISGLPYSMFNANHMEVYHPKDYWVYIWFLDQKVVGFSASTRWSTLDIVAGVPQRYESNIPLD
jgi:hypothetical protein